MQAGNTDMSYVFNELKKLPFVKIPLYYIPFFISMWYFPKETFMLGTSVILFKNLNDETKKREDPNYNPNPFDSEISEEEETSETEEIPRDETSAINENVTENEEGEQVENEEPTLNEDNKFETESQESKEDFNLVENSDDDSVASNSSSGKFWSFFG